MAAGLMVSFVIIQMALGSFFLLWLWIVRVRATKRGSSDSREQLLWFAVTSFTLAVAFDFYFMLAHPSFAPLPKFPVFASFGLACVGILLALLGKGRGRIVTVVACCGLAPIVAAIYPSIALTL